MDVFRRTVLYIAIPVHPAKTFESPVNRGLKVFKLQKEKRPVNIHSRGVVEGNTIEPLMSFSLFLNKTSIAYS